MLHGLKFIIQLMPTLVWKRRPKNGTATAREAAVPDPVVSAATAAPESVVSAAVPAVPDRVGSSGIDGINEKKRKCEEHTQAAADDVAQTIESGMDHTIQRPSTPHCPSVTFLEAFKRHRPENSHPRFSGVARNVKLVPLILPSKHLPHICP